MTSTTRSVASSIAFMTSSTASEQPPHRHVDVGVLPPAVGRLQRAHDVGAPHVESVPATPSGARSTRPRKSACSAASRPRRSPQRPVEDARVVHVTSILVGRRPRARCARSRTPPALNRKFRGSSTVVRAGLAAVGGRPGCSCRPRPRGSPIIVDGLAQVLPRVRLQGVGARSRPPALKSGNRYGERAAGVASTWRSPSSTTARNGRPSRRACRFARIRRSSWMSQRRLHDSHTTHKSGPWDSLGRPVKTPRCGGVLDDPIAVPLRRRACRPLRSPRPAMATPNSLLTLSESRRLAAAVRTVLGRGIPGALRLRLEPLRLVPLPVVPRAPPTSRSPDGCARRLRHDGGQVHARRTRQDGDEAFYRGRGRETHRTVAVTTGRGNLRLERGNTGGGDDPEFRRDGSAASSRSRMTDVPTSRTR